ncbi:hypothetical protein NDN08_006603 [Rhodosorus marinus]|uniref:Receptor expression-enhancing protein n=1 Tax=Rhodosorus marinus TaxID=101924 RepID=A0AAV8UI34_9RHOD|nr:hypothetical protein NDN08_006603 [Rhodosorus marinus]
MSSTYVYYEDDFQPKGPSLFRRILDLFMFMVAVHAFVTQFIALSISCLWVSYLIYKALKTNDKEKQVDLLTASIVFNLIYFVEFLAWWILRFIPLYYELKIVMFIWLLHPKTRGASLIYNNFIAPAFDGVSKRVDYSSAKMNKLISPYLESAATAIQDKYEQAKTSSAEVKPDPNALIEKADVLLAETAKKTQ